MAYLVLHDISKRFGSVQALSQVHLQVERATIHAIVGENGAGKSTLMKILYGLEQPDTGFIELDGVRRSIASPRDAMALGIGMVHQKFQLIPSFTVTENIVLGSEPVRGGLLDLAAARRRVQALVEQYSLGLDPDRPVGELSMGERQRVEIAKILYREAQILIFDEATSVLTPQEAEGLFGVLEQFVSGGKTILYITHKFSEVFRLAREVTVLRLGRTVSSTPVAQTDPRQLARDIIGADELPAATTAGDPAAPTTAGEGPATTTTAGDPATAAGMQPRPNSLPPRPAAPVLECGGLWVVRPDGIPALRGVTLEVHPGEIVGIAGVEGNGQVELAGAIVGIIPIQRGLICLDGVRIDGTSVKERRRQGVGWIPPDRYRLGTAQASSIGENLMAGELDLPAFSRLGVLRPGGISPHVRERIRSFDVRAPGPEMAAGNLSGGNLQKVIVAREVREGLRLLVASNPTNGLDIRATAFVREQLLQLRNQGLGVLLISSDLEEVLELSDRVLVVYRGQVVAGFARSEATRERVGQAMTGGYQPTAEVSTHG